jgi:hypothetical protein
MPGLRTRGFSLIPLGSLEPGRFHPAHSGGEGFRKALWQTRPSLIGISGFTASQQNALKIDHTVVSTEIETQERGPGRSRRQPKKLIL